MSDAIATALRIAERKTDRNPSDAQKESGNYAKGKMPWHGLSIAIETVKGATRSGAGKDGKRWSVKQPASYGYVLGSEAKDGDHVDVYLGPDHASQKVFVIDQIDADTGKYDEAKAMLSYPTKEAALSDYRKAFSDGRAKERIGGVTEMTIEKFKTWVKSSETKKPLSRKTFAAGGRVVAMPMRGFADGGGADWDEPAELADMSGPSTGDLVNSVPRRLAERAMRRSTLKQLSGVDLTPQELSDLAAHGRWTKEVGEPRARSMIMESTGLPGIVRAADNSWNDPSLANFTDLGARTAMTALRPLMALKIMGAGLGTSAARDVAPKLINTAAAEGGLDDGQRKEMRELEGKITNNQFRNAADRRRIEDRLRDLRTIEREAALQTNAAKIKTGSDKASSAQAEFDRSVRRAEAAREKELARDRRFSDTETGKMWEKTGGLAPFVAGGALGALGRAASGGGSAVKDYVLPAAIGGLTGAASSNIPLAYNAFFTEPDNPEQRAYEAYSRELPPDHPRKQEWQDYARGLDKANPIRKVASDELYDPIKALERMGFGAIEGIGGGMAGSELVRLPRRAIESVAGIPGAAKAGYHKGEGRASEAKRVASEVERNAEKSRGLLGREADDAALSQLEAAEARRRSGELVAGPGQSSGAGAPTQRQLPSPELSGSSLGAPAPVIPGTQTPLPPGWAKDKNGRLYEVHTGWPVKKSHYTAKPDKKQSNAAKKSTEDDTGKANGGGVSHAMGLARKYASGGRVLTGAVIGKTDGRGDALPVDVPEGAFVVPADIVAALGSGNTLAGMHKLEKTFGKSKHIARSSGGAVPIRISDGEYVVSPEHVAQLGHGDMDAGHRTLDALVMKLRNQNIKALASLPPPSK